MAMHPDPDRDKEYMYKMWGTTNLITDYWSGNLKKEDTQELREVVGDDLTKENRLKKQNDLHAQIRNDPDYDDWEYGTEPIYE